MTDVPATRDAFKNKEICTIFWIISTENAALGLTTIKKWDTLEIILDIGTLDTKVEQWIEKETKTTGARPLGDYVITTSHRKRTSRVSMIDATVHNQIYK